MIHILLHINYHFIIDSIKNLIMDRILVSDDVNLNVVKNLWRKNSVLQYNNF